MHWFLWQNIPINEMKYCIKKTNAKIQKVSGMISLIYRDKLFFIPEMIFINTVLSLDYRDRGVIGILNYNGFQQAALNDIIFILQIYRTPLNANRSRSLHATILSTVHVVYLSHHQVSRKLIFMQILPPARASIYALKRAHKTYVTAIEFYPS